MEDFITNAVAFLDKASHILMCLVVIATFIAKLTPTPKDDKIVSKISGYILNFIRFLPTLGINPSTKKLEKAYIDLKKDDKNN